MTCSVTPVTVDRRTHEANDMTNEEIDRLTIAEVRAICVASIIHTEAA